MSSIEKQTRNLVESIRLSQEYQSYHRLYHEAQKDAELLKALNEYRRRRFQIQIESDNCLRDGISLKEEFKTLIQNPLAGEFLKSELLFCKMIREINDCLTEGLNLDIHFLEETL